jgi:plasmid stabilization system protein ParE
MKLNVVIETRAARDIDEASGWIAERSPESAERWFNAIEAEVYSLAHFPERCPKARDAGHFAMNCGNWFLGAIGSSSQFEKTPCTYSMSGTGPNRQ